MSDRITVHGLCVRETETGEADKIITLVTEEQGRMSVSAKGVKSLKAAIWRQRSRSAIRCLR